jgi:hypothetical protein
VKIMDFDTDGTWQLNYFYDGEDDYDEGYWTTKNGDRLKIEQMETSHIKNTIAMLKRKDDEDYNNKIEELEEELLKRDIYNRHNNE